MVCQCRENYPEECSAPGFTLHRNVPTVTVYNYMHDCQAEPGALPFGAGGEERIENPGEVGRIYARAVVVYLKHNIRTNGVGADGDLRGCPERRVAALLRRCVGD